MDPNKPPIFQIVGAMITFLNVCKLLRGDLALDYTVKLIEEIKMA